MHHDKHHILLEEGGHPSMELLRQYHEDALSPNLSHQVERHLLACELCSDVLEGMTLSGAESTKAAISDINRKIAAKTKQERKKTVVPTWHVAAAVLLLLCATFVVVYYNYSKLQQEQQSIAAEKEINKSMDLSTPVASDATIEIADSAGEPETETIAAVPPRKNQEEKKVPLILKEDRETVNAVLEEELVEVMDAEESVLYSREVLKNIDTPTVAAALSSVEQRISATESVQESKSEALSIAPESTRVSIALQGKAAGVRIRGLNSLDNGDTASSVVSGQVVSEDGQPLPGVTVQLKGTSTGTTTDAAGRFVLPVSGKKQTLLFHYIGYASAEKAITENTAPLNVQLSPDTKALSEVVVTGYGTTKASEAPAIIPAEPIAGRRAYRKYLKENLRLPAGSEGERGKVVLGFTVTATGMIRNVQVLKSLCPACDAEAIRLIEEGPAWKPATQAGTPIPQQVKVSVPFRQ